MTTIEETRILRRLRLGPTRDVAFIDVVRRGIPTAKASAFIKAISRVVSVEAVFRALGVSRRTLERRRRGRLNAEQSDRLARLIRIVDLATDAIGTEDQATSWLNEPNRALSGARPIDVLDTDAGAHHVEIVLGRLREGSVA